MGSRVPAPRRGLGEGREQNPRLLAGVWGGAAPPAGGCVLGQESPPRLPGKRGPPRAPALGGPARPADAVLAPRAHARVLPTRSSRTFPARPAPQPSDSPSPRRRGKRMPSGRRFWGRQTCRNRAGGVGRGFAPYAGGSAPRPPGPGLGPGEQSEAVGGSPLPRILGDPLPQTGKRRLIHLSMGRAYRRVLVSEFTINTQKHRKGSVWLRKG